MEAAVLFGGVAQKRDQEYSDLDMIIVTSRLVNEVRSDVLSEISRLESKFHTTLEPLILAEEDFLDNVYYDGCGVVYSVAEGYEALVDKRGELIRVLRSVRALKRLPQSFEGASSCRFAVLAR